MDAPKDYMACLLDHGLYNSAQLLGQFLVSSPSGNTETNSNVKAENLMEGIPSKARNLPMHLLMGKLYRNTRHTRAAVNCYKECLRHCPYALEAITAMAELGSSAKEIISLLPQTPSRSGRALSDHLESGRWLQVEAIVGKNDEALMNFEKARSLDPYVVTYMDEYAMLLKKKSEYPKLNKLVHDLLNIDATKPEVFVALSVFWERKDERGALSYAEKLFYAFANYVPHFGNKSIQIDERHVSGYIMKGNLLLSLNRPDAAAVAFRNAQELKPDLRSYQGLVHSYLAISKVKEALYIAREAMKTMPQSAKALKLVGDVHAKSSSGREKAKKFYESALRLEPGYLGAALALAELHVVEGRNGEAVSLLERYLKDWADDSLHVKLAQVFAATNMLQEALSHYQAALRINSQSEAAKKGLDRLEKLMKGVDPDAP
uniref:Anaphase-promoting complex subunit 7 n=1 Tax=Chenopodium quinoa TaxID=63459 RepID=A0A803N9L7_CHEQI